MPKNNADNERIKHRYQVWMRDAKGFSDATIDQALAAINRFEAHTSLKPLRLFHIEQARAFSRDLQAMQNPKTGKPYAKATVDSTLAALRRFIDWLAGQPEGRNRIRYGDADYFRLSRKDERVARAVRAKRVPSVDEIVSVLAAMPVSTEVEQRNRALIAFTLLTCARVQALITAKIKHVDLKRQVFHQDARDVRTKFAKTFDTTFFPVGDDAANIVTDWIAYLIKDKRFGPDDPLFPKPDIGVQPGKGFTNQGLGREHYASTGPVRSIFSEAFKAHELPPPKPHVFRDTITQLGEKVCATPEEFKAFSQNIGHDRVMTTFTSYGAVASGRQAELIRGLRGEGEGVGPVTPEMVKVVLDHLQGQTRR